MFYQVTIASPSTKKVSEHMRCCHTIVTSVSLLPRAKSVKSHGKAVLNRFIKFNVVIWSALPFFPLRHTSLKTLDINE